jgi:hypothetical protein
MYHYFKKTLFLFFLPAFLGLAGCGNDDLPDLEGMTVQEIQGLFVGEWKETERIDPLNLDSPIRPEVRDTTIVFFPDGTFQGSIIELNTYYTIDKEYLYTGGVHGNYRFLYSFMGKNKLILDMDSGAIPENIPSPTIFSYIKIK